LDKIRNEILKYEDEVLLKELHIFFSRIFIERKAVKRMHNIVHSQGTINDPKNYRSI
jgi:hypothetical protein